MDQAVGLVDGYLQANGYLTVTEYAVVEALDDGGYRTITDIDVLAVRLPGAGRIVPTESGDAARETRLFDPDPNLIDPDDDEWVDFIIGEVKEGKAVLNRGARDPNTLMTAIRRFAFVAPDVAESIVDELIRTGRARLPDRKVQWRLFAFGGKPPDRPSRRYRVLLLRECVEYILGIARQHGLLGVTRIKHPTMSLVALLVKTGLLRDRT
jgi:hypothetical protein